MAYNVTFPVTVYDDNAVVAFAFVFQPTKDQPDFVAVGDRSALLP